MKRSQIKNVFATRFFCISSSLFQKKMCAHIVIFLLYLLLQVNCLFNLNLIESYFIEKSTKSASILGCFNKREQVEIAKIFMSKTRPVSVMNINRERVFENLKTKHNPVGVILDGDCPKSEPFLEKCGRLKFFDAKHHWLIPSSSSLDIIKKFEKVVLNINADIHIAVPNNSFNWTIADIYNAASERGGVLNYTQIGFYNERQGYNARSNEAKYWKRKNMTGVTFKTMVTLPAPYEGTYEDHMYKEEHKEVNTFNRFHTKLLRYCEDFYNFSMNMSTTKSWGYPFPNGSFDGMVGAMQQKTVDFGCSPIFIRTDRAKFVDYGRNTWAWKAGFLFRSPKSRTSIEIFWKPLSGSVWLITGLLAVLSICILKATTTFERRKFHRDTETSWSMSVIVTLGALCQQGSPSTPRMTCGRIATISIFLLSVIIYQFYSASIVSNLLMKPINKIKNVKDLLDSQLKVGCENEIYNRDLFAHTTDPILRQLYYKKIYGKGNTSHFLPTLQGLKLVGKGDYAFHVEVARAYRFIETTFSDNAICELREVELYRNKDLYGTYQKGSPFRDMIETCLHRIAENGILDKEKKNWHPRKPECVTQNIVTFNVGLDEFYPALLTLLIGMAISFVIFIAEIRKEICRGRKLRLLQKKKQKPYTPFVN